MRSNVKKMWTALLAVLFAAAVGFGLWFAFAPAARPANVHAAEGYSLTLESKQENQTLSSNSSIDSDLLYNESYQSGFIGVTIYRDGTPISSSEYVTTMKFYAYSDADCTEKVDDFRPLSNETGSTFYRYVKVSIEVVGIGEIMSDNSVMLTVTAETLDTIEAEVIGGKYFDALTSFEDIAAERLEVFAYYEGDRKSYPLEYAGVYEGEVKEKNACYGGYWIEYQDDPDDENDRTDCLEYGDTKITIWYREGNSQPKPYEISGLIVNEAYIDAPTMADSFEEEVTYDGTEHTFSFTRFNSAEMSYSVTYNPNVGDQSEETGTEEDSSISIKKTEAGSYAVKFSVKEGYQFRSPSIPEEDIERVGDKIIGVTYHFTIKKAQISSVTFDESFKTRYTYGDTITAPQKSAITLHPATTVTLPEEGTELTADWAEAVLSYSYTGTDGTSYGPSSMLPTDAGNYSWTVSLTGMNNFENFTGTDDNGGSGSFVIEKKTLDVPKLDYLSFTYNKQDQAPEPIVPVTEKDPYTFSVTKQTNVGDYTAAFSLKNTNNYEWASGSSAKIEGATATYTWVIVKASVTVPTLTSKEYNGQPQKADIPSELYTAEQENNWINAGKYNATLKLIDSTNYEWNDGTVTVGDNDEKRTVTFIITQKKVEIIWSNTTPTYNGTPQAPTATIKNKIGNDDVSLSVSGAETNANTDGATYTATASLKGNAKDNYTLDGAENTTCSFTISPYQIGVEGTLSISSWTYGDEPNAPSGMSIAESSKSIATSGGDTLTGEYLYYTSNDSSAQPLEGIPTDAGSYWVRYHAYSNTENFTEAYSQFVSFTIAKKTIGIKWGTLEFIYNGQPQQPTAEPTGVVDDDTLTLTVSVEGEHTNAGTNYTATASLAGTDKDNYVLNADTATISFSIAKKSIGIDWGTTEFTYNGEEQAPTAKPTGVVDGDDLTLTVTVSGEHKDAGDYTATAELSGMDAGNYQLPADATKEFVIHKAKLSVGGYLSEPQGYQGTNENDRQIVFSGNIDTSKLIIDTSSNLFTVGDRLDADGNESDATSVGQYAVTLTLTDPENYKWEGGKDDEINGATITVKYWITQSQFSITVSFNDDTWTYGGTAGTPSIAVNISGGTESFAYYATKEDAQYGQNALGAMPTDAGNYWVVGIVAATDDYAQSVSAPVSFTINKVEIGIAWGSETSFTYNGTPQAPTATATGAVNDEVLTLTLEGQATNVGTYTATVTGIMIGDEAANNYQLPADGLTIGFTITQRAISVTLNEYTVTYNGAAFSGSFTTSGRSYNGQTLFTIEEGGLCGSDTLEGEFTYPKNAINAGSYAWGSIAWSNQNYKVIVTNGGEEMFVIDKAPITVKINDQSSVYGENIVSLTVGANKEQETALYTVTGTLYDNADTIFSLSTEAENISDVGEYAITGSVLEGEGSRGGNYNVIFVGEEKAYSITARELKVVLNDFEAVYGTKETTETLKNHVTFSYNGSETVFVSEDDRVAALEALSFTVGDGSYAENSAAGSTWTVTPDVDPVQNYTFTVQSGTMTVKPRPITVEISDVSVTYGTAGTLGVNSVSYTGGGSSEAVISSDLAGGDGAEKYANVFTLALYENNSGTLGKLIAPDDYGSLNRGEYLISLTKVSENYEITFEDATYTVNAQSIGVILVLDTRGHEESSPVFDGLAWKYLAYGSDESGASIEEITFHVTYYHALQDVRGDELNGAPVNAGSYYAVVDTVLDEDGNYIAGGSFSVPFTIAQREVVAEWLVDGDEVSDYSLGYNGDTGYTITAQYSGWTNGSKNAAPTSLSVTAPSDFRNVGSYSFTATFATGAEKGNYKFGDQDDEDSVTHEFTIIKAPITVAIKPQTSIYGENIVSPTVEASKNTETALYTVTGTLYDNANTIFSLLTTATSESDADSYDIVGTATGANSNNYAVTFVNAEVSTSEVGTYTVTRRPVVIDLEDFEMIYGTDISAVDNHEKLVSLSKLGFGLGAGTTDSPFLTKDSDAVAAAKSAMNFDFTGTSGTYDAQSAANTTWTVTASLSDQASDDLKNYTFVAGASTMTVIPRPITVTLPELGNTSYTYGTGALQNAFPTFEATVSIDDEWKGYGESIVFNDNAAGGVYTLVVKNEKGEEITLSASAPVGTYTLAGKAGANSNYSVTFTAEQTFEVTEAQFKVNAQDPVSVSVVYTGKNYYFRPDAADGQDSADTYLFDYGLSVTTANFVLSEENIAYTWEFQVDSEVCTYLTDAGTYTVSYTVTADNFEQVTGSFTVIISQAENSWTAGMTTTDGGTYEQASWTYGDPEKYPSLNWTDTFTGYAPETSFVAAFGGVHIEYYKTRSGGPSEYTYSDRITDPNTFFGCETDVGTYYVKVFVEATKNFTGLTAHGTIEVKQRAVDIDWAANNITVDGETHEGTNTTIGFDNTLMTVDTESLPQGLTIVDGPSATGEITVNVKAEGTTQFYLYFELIDPDNYCWQNSATVSGDKGERIQINFTTNALQNNVTFVGQDGDLEQNTGISISFGTELRYKFAASSGDTIGDEHLLIFADSTLANETLNYYISFAKTTQEDEEPKGDSYTLATLEGADAGYYWLRVQVYPTSDSSYGYGIGYLKICVTQREIAQGVIDGIDFGLSGDELHFTYDGRPHQPSAEGVPSYLHVTFSGSATNVCDEGVTVTATFIIADDNYKFADGVSPTREIIVVIDPAEIGHIVWSDREYTYNGTDQTEDVYAYFVDVFGVEHRLCVTAEGGFISVTADGTTFTALLELYGEQEDFCIQNYKFAEGLAELTHVYKMAKATVEIGIGDAEAVYTGEPIEIDQTQYALRTAISLSDPELLDFLSKIRLIAVDADGKPAVNVDEYKIILEEKEWAYTNIEIVFNDSYAGQLTVSPAVLEVPVLDETQFVYNGSVQKPNVAGVDGVYDVKNEGGTDVRDYTVTLTLLTDNYRWETTDEKAVTLTYKIVQAEYSFAYDVSDTVYNGKPVSVNAPELPAGETGAPVAYLFTGMMNGGRAYLSSDAPTEAGSYTVTVTISGMKNYKDAEESAEFTIERAPIEVSLTFKPQVDGGNGWVYGTTPEDIYELDERSNPGGGGVTETYSTGDWSGSAIPTEVGSYTLTVTVDETANYKSGSVSVEFEIVRASEGQLSFSVTIESWTYGETPNAPSVTWGGDLTGHPDGISPTYTYATAKADGETYSDEDFSSTVPTNAGSYVVKATFAQTDNYGKLSAMCQFTIEKATALIDTSGMQKSFTYNGRAQALSGAVLNHSETTLSYSPATVTAVGSYTVTISAKESENYTAATATVTVTVSRASAGFSVRIDDWTYGETPNSYTISGGSGGSVTVTYSGTTNAGVKYSSSKVPTEAGEYTIIVVMSASGNYSGGTARDSFTIHRADAGAELTLAGWAYGETPNSYLLTPEFLRDEVIRAVYSDGTYFSEAVPQDVGSYTLTVTYGETDNYLGGEVSCKFSITRYDLGLSVSIEGWTYGDEPNKPVVTGADIVGLTLSYTGTANDGTTWSSNTAPEKAGSYTLTVTVTKAGSYTGESASTDFVIARRLLSAPAWDEEGMRELIEVCSGDRMTRAILGFDMSLMNAQSATAQFMFDGTGAASVTANIHGVYTIVVSLRDAANYGWADLNEGETLTGPVTLTWTLTERVISLLWLIILLAVLIVIALIVLIVLLKKGGKPDGTDTEEGGKPDGTDTGKGDVRLSSVAPVGLLLVVAPTGQLVAVIVLGAVLLALVAADIVLGVRNAKRAKAAENAQEPVPAYGDEAAAEGEAYPGTEVPADDGAEVASDEDGMPE